MKVNQNALIELVDLTKYYTSEGGVGLGLHKVNAKFNLGEFVVITGASGTGKTTLLNVITGMDSYEEGELLINGEDTAYYSSLEYENYRRKYVSFIFQNYNLIDSFTVYQNVELALIARGIPKKQRHQEVLKIIGEVGLTKRLKHRITKLSGGEKQRVAIARAIASDAPIIACDEITGNLDSKTSLEIISLLRKVSKGKLVLLVSHDVNEALEYATRVIVMHDGKIDKDYQTGLTYTEDELHIKEHSQVKKVDNFKLSLNSLFSTPSKFLLLFTMVFIVTILLFFIVSFYQQSDSVSETLIGEQYVSSMGNYNDTRLVVKKEKNQKFTSEEISKLKKMNKVIELYENDRILDSSIFVYSDNEEYPDYFSVYATKILTSSMLTLGRLPENDNEVVLEFSEDMTNLEYQIGDQIFLACYGMQEAKKVTITGIRKTDAYNSFVYMTGNLIKELSDLNSLYSISLEIGNIEYENYQFLTNNQWVVDESLSDNEIIIESRFPVYDTEKPVETTSNYQSSIIISNGIKDYQLMDANTQISVQTKYYNYNDKIENRIKAENVIKMSSRKYQELLNYSQDIYQVSLIAKTPQNIQDLSKELEKDVYITSGVSLVKNDNELAKVIASLVVKGTMILYCSLMFIGISAILYAIIKNVIKTQQKNFLVMRSLGIDGKKIEKQIFTELIFIMLISYLPVLIIWLISKIRSFEGLLGYISQVSIGGMAFILVVLAVLMIILGYRYTTSILSSTIVNKEME